MAVAMIGSPKIEPSRHSFIRGKNDAAPLVPRIHVVHDLATEGIVGHLPQFAVRFGIAQTTGRGTTS